MSGPKVAPKPAHAKDTTWKITLFSSNAMTMAMAVMINRVILETSMTCLSVAFFLITPWNTFFANAEAAMRR